MTPLHQFGEFLRELLLRVPLGGARLLFLATFIALLVWVLTLSPRETTDPAAGGTRNLKPWAVLALLVQLGIYALL